MVNARRNQGTTLASLTATALFALLPQNPLFVQPVTSFTFPRSCSRRATSFQEEVTHSYRSSLMFRNVDSIQINSATKIYGWVQQSNGEWEWKEDDPAFLDQAATSTADISVSTSTAKAAPKLPSGTFRPKQSLGQNFLQDGNTIQKIVKAFAKDATETVYRKDSNSKLQEAIEGKKPGIRAVELGPGAGALTGPLIETFGTEDLQCIEIDPRAVELLHQSHPNLRVTHMDVLQADYVALAKKEGGPLSVVGNLPYYITSQILFALADASHSGAVRSATVTMQWEVAQRIVAPTNCKDYGILSVVFQLYADCTLHFKIPPTVFYPKPKVFSALVGLRFIGPAQLRKRLGGVTPVQLRQVLTCTFQQRRKTVRNSLKQLVLVLCGGDAEAANAILASESLPLPASVLQARGEGDAIAMKQELPLDWSSLRPEQLSPGQIVEITRIVFFRSRELTGRVGHEIMDDKVSQNEESYEARPLENKVWRKLKHGS